MGIWSDLLDWLTALAQGAWLWLGLGLVGLWDSIVNWLANPAYANNFWPALISGALLLIGAGLLRLAGRGFGRVPGLLLGLTGRRASAEATALADYQHRLTEHSLRLRHAWMKEGQTLGDIMVPVSVELGGDGGGIEHLSTVIGQVFADARGAQPPRAPRIIVIGGPGSGKSVALRLLARDGWGLAMVDGTGLRDGLGLGLIPVLLSFADLSAAGLDLKAAIVQSLAGHGLVRLRGLDGGIDGWVATALDQGRLLVLIDALDELGQDRRALAARAVNQAFATWPRAPFIISCRTAAWRDQVQDPDRVRIDMAPFPPAAVRRFVQRWRFAPPKSAGELIGVIRRQPHVAALARNPLMLTIVCFLYGQPKYRLPDNRAQFYEVCSRALLEEWDQAQSRDRANQFDRPHKEHLLAVLALDHLDGQQPDQDLDEDQVLRLLARRMRDDLGLDWANNHRLLEELVQNAGLLVRLPPTGLRFPHQTFLEYFAAKRLDDDRDPEALLGRHRADPNRWREVLLLYCGLCPRKDTVAQVIDHLLRHADLPLALTALTEARIADPDTAARVLAAAAARLRDHPDTDPALIEALGYLGANPLTTYGPRAAALLHQLLRERGHRLPADQLQTLLLAALRRPTEDLSGFLVDNIDRLDLGRILPAMAEDALLASAAVLREPAISLPKKLEWIDGLRRAQVIEPLLALEVQPWPDPAIPQALRIALARCSRLPDFWTLADQPRDPPEPSPIDADTDRVLSRWGWPYEPPRTDAGRRLCCRLALALSQAISEPSLEDCDHRLGYLACALAIERDGAQAWGWEPAKQIATGRPGTLRAIWRRAPRGRWAGWVRFTTDGDIPEVNLSTAWIFTNGALSLLLLASVVSGVFGWVSLGVPWHPAISLGILLAGVFSMAIFLRIDKGDWDWDGATIALVFGSGLTVPLFAAPWEIARLADTKAPGKDWQIHGRTSAALFRFGVIALPLTLAAFSQGGLLLNALLILCLLLNLIEISVALAFATSPTAPSEITHALFEHLRQANPPT